MLDKVVRLSDAEEMLTKAQIISDGEYNGYCTEDVNLSMLPIADYAPVVHAHWIKDKRFIRDDDEIYDFCCSRCHGRALRDDYDNYSIFSSFCPTCGAKMGEEREAVKDGIH